MILLPILLCAAMLYLAYALLERWVLAVMVVLMLVLSSGCNGLQTPYPHECHKAIRYAIYASSACVIQEI